MLSKLLLLLTLLSPSTFAEEQKENLPDPLEKYEDDLVPIPVVYYTPETGIAFGATMIYAYKLKGQNREQQNSTVFPAVVYTQNKQTLLVARFRHIYGQDAWRQNILVFYSIFPNKFYGIGDSTQFEDEELFNSTNRRYRFSLSRRVIKNLYLGGTAIYNRAEIYDLKEGGILESEAPLGSKGSDAKGYGYFIDYDSADDNFNPTKGVRSRLTYNTFPKTQGSTFEFQEVLFYVRHYVNVTDTGQIAFALTHNQKYGDVPFTSLSQLGGQRLMRGIFQGRYRDNSFAVLQTEWRDRIDEKWGWVGFLSVGHVAPEARLLTLKRAKFTAGGGVRFTVSKKANTVLRVDTGFTDEGYGGTYFGIGQAF